MCHCVCGCEGEGGEVVQRGCVEDVVRTKETS